MSTSNVYPGGVFKTNVNDSQLCLGCKQDLPRQRLGSQGAVEFEKCECGQYLMITGRQGCGTMAFTVAIEAFEVPTNLVPAGS